MGVGMVLGVLWGLISVACTSNVYDDEHEVLVYIQQFIQLSA